MWFGPGVVAGLAVLAWVVIMMQQLSSNLRDANDARDALAAQVQQLGCKPVADRPDPAASRGRPSPARRGREAILAPQDGRTTGARGQGRR